jgi:hypothetical protein
MQSLARLPYTERMTVAQLRDDAFGGSMVLTAVPTIDEVLADVQAMDGVTRIVAGTAQVLVHRQHIPHGFYILVKGSLVVSDGAHVSFIGADDRAGPLLVPAMGELELPAWRSARVEVGAVYLYVPRSLALFDPGIRRQIQVLDGRSVSLQQPRGPVGPAGTQH